MLNAGFRRKKHILNFSRRLLGIKPCAHMWLHGSTEKLVVNFDETVSFFTQRQLGR